MNQYAASVLSLISRSPSAFVPMAMSLTALAWCLGSIAAFGVMHEPDEGVVAHIWQLLMAGQVPIIAYFVIKWLPRAPRQTLYVLALQIGAALAAMAPVYFLGL
jgi:hypothetical protein